MKSRTAVSSEPNVAMNNCRVDSAPRFSAQPAVARDCVRNFNGLGPTTYSSARRPESSAARWTRSLKTPRFAHGVAAGGRPEAELELSDSKVGFEVVPATGVVAGGERGPYGDTLARFEQLRQRQADGGGVNQVVEPAEVAAHQQCRGEEVGAEPGLGGRRAGDVNVRAVQRVLQVSHDAGEPAALQERRELCERFT